MWQRSVISAYRGESSSGIEMRVIEISIIIISGSEERAKIIMAAA